MQEIAIPQQENVFVILVDMVLIAQVREIQFF